MRLLLLQEQLVQDEMTSMLGSFLHGVPGKTLLLESGHFLRTQIWGGWCAPRDTKVGGGMESSSDPAAFSLRPVEETKTPTTVEAALEAHDVLEKVQKEDGQKEDDAAVTVRLWETMFLEVQAADQKIRSELASRWREGLSLLCQLHLPL